MKIPHSVRGAHNDCVGLPDAAMLMAECGVHLVEPFLNKNRHQNSLSQVPVQADEVGDGEEGHDGNKENPNDSRVIIGVLVSREGNQRGDHHDGDVGANSVQLNSINEYSVCSLTAVVKSAIVGQHLAVPRRIAVRNRDKVDVAE